MRLLIILSFLLVILSVSALFHETVEYFPKISEQEKSLKGSDLTRFVNLNQKLWRAEPSKFTDYEKRARLSNIRYIKSNEDEQVQNAPVLADIPATFDARQNWPSCTTIQQIRDQSDCGSSAQLAVAAVASDRTCIFSNSTFNWPLSAEDPLSCCIGLLSICGDGYGCEGSWPQDILKWWVVHGLCTGGEYYDQFGCKPYSIYPCNKTFKNGTTAPPCPGYHTPTCEHKCTSNVPWPIDYLKDKHFGKSHYKVGKKMTDIQTEIITNGPVVASFILYDDFWDYKSGIYVHTAGDMEGGMVTKIIGWGAENGVPYWLCAHQWGDDFGENGYFRILRGVNECNLEHQVIAGLPDVDKHN